MIKHLEAAYGTAIFLFKPFLYAFLHKEVAEIAWKYNYLVIHSCQFFAYLANSLATVFLIELIQIMQIKSLKLENVVAIL